MKPLGPRHQLRLGLLAVRVRQAGIHRADPGTLLLLVEGDALGAAAVVDDVDLLAGADGLVGAHLHADPAADAVVHDDGGHPDMLAFLPGR